LVQAARRTTRILLAARGMRALGDGLVSLLLPAYLVELGFANWEIGVLTTATLLGSAALTLWVGMQRRITHRRTLLLGAALLMTATGLAMAGVGGFWPLFVVAFVGTMNPSAGDVSLFLPLEQSLLAHVTEDRRRTAAFGRYSLVGSLLGAAGALAAGLPDLAAHALGWPTLTSLRAAFLLYAAFGLLSFTLYRRLPLDLEAAAGGGSGRLDRSRGIVLRLAALFSLDSFAGGLVVQSLLALYLFQRFDLSLAAAATIFFWMNLLSAFSYPVAVRLAGRFGLVNTMVFTHLPANLCLMAVPFAPSLPPALALLFMRSALSQMDVPARTSYVMAVVTPAERAAAASITNVPRSLASAAGPALAGWLLTISAFGWPLLACGALKSTYDLLLLAMFRHVRPPEERREGTTGDD
jgi:MFS family permease